MNLIEFIGFVIAIIALFAIMIRRSLDEKRRREHPELYEHEEEDRERELKEFLRTLEIDVEEPPPPPPPAPPPPEEKPVKKRPARPKRLVRDAYELERRIEKYEKTKGIESRTLESEVGETEFRELGQEIVTGDLFLQTGLGAYEIVEEQKSVRVAQLFENLEDPSQMIIHREVLGKPKAFQRHILPHDLSE